MPEKVDAESSFRESLKDVSVILDRLQSHCQSLPDMLSLVNLALENDAQLRLLMVLVTKKK